MGGPAGTWQSRDSLLQAPWSALGSRSWSPQERSRAWWGPANWLLALFPQSGRCQSGLGEFIQDLRVPTSSNFNSSLASSYLWQGRGRPQVWNQRAEDLRSILTPSQEAWKGLPVF